MPVFVIPLGMCDIPTATQPDVPVSGQWLQMMHMYPQIGLTKAARHNSGANVQELLAFEVAVLAASVPTSVYMPMERSRSMHLGRQPDLCSPLQ